MGLDFGGDLALCLICRFGYLGFVLGLLFWYLLFFVWGFVDWCFEL